MELPSNEVRRVPTSLPFGRIFTFNIGILLDPHLVPGSVWVMKILVLTLGGYRISPADLWERSCPGPQRSGNKTARSRH